MFFMMVMILSNKYKFYRKQKLTIDQAVKEAVRYCLEHNIMTEYLRNNEKEVIDMFGFEWNEKEEKDALIKVGEARGKLVVKLEVKSGGH